LSASKLTPGNDLRNQRTHCSTFVDVHDETDCGSAIDANDGDLRNVII
jgi:hypothetical protein